MSIAEYAQAWILLSERERLACDLVMFCGLRACEEYALQRKHVLESVNSNPSEIRIEQGWYKGKIVGPKDMEKPPKGRVASGNLRAVPKIY